MIKKTGKIKAKRYKCNSCGYVAWISTNHYGDIYVQCIKCSPNELSGKFSCCEPLPEGWGVPDKWQKVDLKHVLYKMEE